MDREALAALHDAIGALLRLPDGLLERIVQWAAPKAARPPGPGARGNGLDLHQPPELVEGRMPPAPYVGKSERGRPKISAKTAERKLLAAMRDNPGLSVIALANAAGSSRSATGERLRQLAVRGAVEKDLTGRWKLKAEETEPRPTGEETRPTLAPSS